MCRSYCLVLQKFLDHNGNGIRDAGEPPLAGIGFEFVVGDEIHRRDTDANGIIRFCRSEPEVIHIQEVTRIGYGLSTYIPAWWQLTCGDSGLLVGNVPPQPPATGLGRGGRW